MSFLEQVSVREFLARLNVFLWVAKIAVNYSVDIPAAARAHNVAIDPAPYAFAIWGLIYTSTLGYVLRECFCNVHGDDDVKSGLIRFCFSMTCILNMAWCITFTQNIIWASFIFLVALWAFLLKIFLHYVDVKEPFVISPNYVIPSMYTSTSKMDYLFRRFPFSLYFSWTTAACLLSFAGLFGSFGITLELWPSLLLCCYGLVIFVWLTLYFSDCTVAAVGVWVFTGIVVRCLGRVKSYNAYLADPENVPVPVDEFASWGHDLLLVSCTGLFAYLGFLASLIVITLVDGARFGKDHALNSARFQTTSYGAVDTTA